MEGVETNMNINGFTKVYCLIGDPVEHSLSPLIYNTVFREYRLNCVYVAFKVKRGELKEAIRGLRALGIAGANITMPHKIEVIRYLDKIDEISNLIGCVNVVINDKGYLKGSNTDSIGILKTLEKFTDVNGKKVVVLGAGGAGRAAVIALLKKVSKIFILNRTEKKAIEFAGKLRGMGFDVVGLGLTVKNLKKALKNADILINATPIGMSPNDAEIPVPKKLLTPRLVILDLVYAPLITRFLKEAKEKGCITIDGLWVLIFQAIENLKLWFKITVPSEWLREMIIKNWSVSLDES